MPKRKGRWVGFVLLGWALLSGGCIDAVGEGFATGVADGIAAVIEDLITSSAEGFPGDDE